MDNLQTAMGEAQWARLTATKRPYRVLPPEAPGAVSYWLLMALFADQAGRTDLAQVALDAAGEAVL